MDPVNIEYTKYLITPQNQVMVEKSSDYNKLNTLLNTPDLLFGNMNGTFEKKDEIVILKFHTTLKPGQKSFKKRSIEDMVIPGSNL